mgnify:CR=1 FL=1
MFFVWKVSTMQKTNLKKSFCVRLEAKQRLRYSDGLKDGLIWTFFFYSNFWIFPCLLLLLLLDLRISSPCQNASFLGFCCFHSLPSSYFLPYSASVYSPPHSSVWHHWKRSWILLLRLRCCRKWSLENEPIQAICQVHPWRDSLYSSWVSSTQ